MESHQSSAATAAFDDAVTINTPKIASSLSRRNMNSDKQSAGSNCCRICHEGTILTIFFLPYFSSPSSFTFMYIDPSILHDLCFLDLFRIQWFEFETEMLRRKCCGFMIWTTWLKIVYDIFLWFLLYKCSVSIYSNILQA